MKFQASFSRFQIQAARLLHTVLPWRFGIALLLGAFSVAISQPVMAQDRSSDQRWALRIFATGLFTGTVEARAVSDTPAGPEQIIHSVSDADGFSFGLEFLLTRRLGVEVSAALADYDTDYSVTLGDIRLTDSETLGMYAVFVGVNYHIPIGRAAVRVGLFTGINNYDDVIFLTESGRQDKLAFDDDYGFGVKVAVDYAIVRGGPWMVSAEIRYMDTILEAESNALGDLDLDPFSISLGVGYGF